MTVPTVLLITWLLSYKEEKEIESHIVVDQNEFNDNFENNDNNESNDGISGHIGDANVTKIKDSSKNDDIEIYFYNNNSDNNNNDNKNNNNNNDDNDYNNDHQENYIELQLLQNTSNNPFDHNDEEMKEENLQSRKNISEKKSKHNEKNSDRNNNNNDNNGNDNNNGHKFTIEEDDNDNDENGNITYNMINNKINNSREIRNSNETIDLYTIDIDLDINSQRFFTYGKLKVNESDLTNQDNLENLQNHNNNSKNNNNITNSSCSNDGKAGSKIDYKMLVLLCLLGGLAYAGEGSIGE